MAVETVNIPMSMKAMEATAIFVTILFSKT